MDTVAGKADMEGIIARTALKYDLLPYQSKAFAQSQPSRLGSIARLFGLETTPMEGARVLELGCASGGNIIPHAVRYPDATFVGVDLARMQVAAGRSRIAKLGLSNIEILCQSFTEIGDELGAFDYIICHGVYSWVPAPVQDAIFRIIRGRLSPTGIACVSYNVLPGWRMLQPMRAAFLLQVPDHVDSRARVARARELLDFMKDSSPDKGPYGDMIRSWAERLSHLPDDYIAHEFLEETNLPSTVREFTASAARHGLGYLAECELSSMILDNHGAAVAQQIRERAGNDLVESEQYLDLLTGRTFRQSVLVASERMADVERALTPERLEGLHFAGPAGLAIEREDDRPATVRDASRSMTVAHPAVVDAISTLIGRFPATSSLDEMTAGLDAAERMRVREALYHLVIGGMVQVASEPVLAVRSVSERPVALALARADAAAGESFTTNQRHETVSIDAAAHILLPAMDGTNDHAALADLLRQAAKAGKITFNRHGSPVEAEDDVDALIGGYLPDLLAGIAAAGLIER